MPDLKAIEARHENLRGECFDCYRMVNADRADVSEPPVFSASVWPCDAAILLAHVRELREVLGEILTYASPYECWSYTWSPEGCAAHDTTRRDGVCPVARARRLTSE